MNNKLNNMLEKFYEENDCKSLEEMNEKLQEFMMKYNEGELEYKNTPLDDAYEILEKAENASNKKDAIKYAKKAYELCPECFDAHLFLVELEDKMLTKEKLLDDGLKVEEDRLKKEGYFSKDKVGSFYGIFETRPYMRGLLAKVSILIETGKIIQAKAVCKKMIQLNENDNLGARYLLLSIYAYLEDEKEFLKLYDLYQEECFETIFSFFILYYKLDDVKKAEKYLKKSLELNSNILKYFKGTMEVNDELPFGAYSRGDGSEILVYMTINDFLVATVPYLEDYIYKFSKEMKKKKM